MNIDPYASGVLDKAVHERIVADIGNYAKDALIKPSWIWTSMTETCDGLVIDWVKKFRTHQHNDIAGLCFVGENPFPNIEDRMAAIAGALIRNFVRPKVLTLNMLVDAAEEGDIPDMSCVLVPNFFIDKKSGGTLAPWKVAALLDTMIFRRSQGLQTVVYVTDMSILAVEYGLAVRKHLESHYVIVEV
jgi:hypothetical protein